MKYSSPFILLLCLLISVSSGFSQQQIPSTFQGKHHMLSKEELDGTIDTKSFFETAPPAGHVRNIAEFEHNEGILVAYMGWGFGIPVDLIAEISEDVNVTTIVYNQEEEDAVRSYYGSNNVNMDHISFIQAPNNSYWCRDYGPWFVAVNDTVSIINFPYNRDRPNDNDIPLEYALYSEMNVFGMNLIHTGGNWMCDGMGIAASTDLVYEENPALSQNDIHSLVKDYLGIEMYHVTPDPLDDYIKHVDCWGKFLDVDKILISKVSESDYRYDDYEEMANYWAGQTSSYGNKYQVYRVYSPNGQPYTNSLIVNNKVMVPVVSGLGSDYNDEALETYRNAMPGYEVIGFYENAGTPWEPTDALHCRTHEIPDREMLYIQHMPLIGGVEEQTEYTIQAEISSYGKHELSSCDLYYQVNGGPFMDLPMSFISGNTYEAIIPNPISKSQGDEIGYFIQAEDTTGRIMKHPYIGEADPHVFTIGGTTSVANMQTISFDFRVFPNPVGDDLFISIQNDQHSHYMLDIIDVRGSIIKSIGIHPHPGNYIKKMDASDLHEGMYMIRVRGNENLTRVKRFVVQ